MTPLIASILLMFATANQPAAAAELVLVDGLGPTSLRGFDCTAIARSALVSSVCHDPSRDFAIAVVGGRARAYCDVPKPLVDAWLAAPSMGRFHAERIEPAHRCD
ncbi:MAG: KTSC domain-containing protein [Burkholderiaceae bacterium]|nr:KTSC domain-containing protein [Burkholderiales bacterium]MCZ8098046.1 KTSC domain-containing protein [Burkholderiales bacterium]MCZ8339315.1 KTSC domain-containing protein [Burkholderiaceae bacterium]